MAALSAAPASAIIVRLPNGRTLSYMAPGGPKANIFDVAFHNLDYGGGPVMPANTDYTVVWNPSNYSGTAFQTGYTSGINTFFTDLAHDSGGSTNSDAVAAQYNDVSGHTSAYSSTNGGTLTDTDPLPSNGCTAATICLTDAQLQAELNSFLSAQGKPHDLSHEYFLLTPPSVASCFDTNVNDGCSLNSPGGNPSAEYCAYHGVTTASYVYANIPDLTGGVGCDPFVTLCKNTTCIYDNGPADGMLTAVSHEQNESTTDPQPNNAWTDFGGAVPIGEIGDKCNNDGMNDPSLHRQTFGTTDTPYNEVINNHHYLIQREWSNQTAQCRDGLTPSATAASAKFVVTAVTGNFMTFNAAASTATGGVAEYVWQFNDGPFGQNFTQETSSPTITHTFPAAGQGYVALTVFASDGTSNGTARVVLIGGSLPSATFAPPSGTEGVPVGFSAAGSTDPNFGGSITSYSWNFGDGTTGSGPAPSHTYAHFGNYTVTLTTTDNYSFSASVSHVASISDEHPGATFTAPAGGQARLPVSFSASGLDPDGSILSYAWTFGDGRNGAGKSLSHAFHAPGVYTVTLTVSDSAGQTGAIVHQVTIGASCIVPNVKHKSLKAAKKAIKAAHCSVGKVKAPKHHAQKPTIKKQSPAAGAVERAGSKVNLTLT